MARRSVRPHLLIVLLGCHLGVLYPFHLATLFATVALVCIGLELAYPSFQSDHGYRLWRKERQNRKHTP